MDNVLGCWELAQTGLALFTQKEVFIQRELFKRKEFQFHWGVWIIMGSPSLWKNDGNLLQVNN